jgi:hypothetical protein
MPRQRERCAAAIYVRDTYRVNRTGRGPHFKMYYAKEQCSRTCKDGSRYCWQHQDERGRTDA